MKLLEQVICTEGRILPGNILKVDGFLNHRMDVELLSKLGEEFYRLYGNCGVNKILTIEASGIGIACLTAQFFHCPVLYAKKSKSSNVGDNLWSSKVHSYTHNTDHDVVVSKSYLGPEDRVLIIDDFLANGSALSALIDLCKQAGAQVVGAGIAIEKAYQEGGNKIRKTGVRVESLARVLSMDPETGVQFC